MSTIKKLAARFRRISSTLDNRNEVTPQESDKRNSQRKEEVRDRAETTLKDGPSAATGGRFDATPQLPGNYYLGFKICNQFWDPKKDQWTEAYRVPLAENPPSDADRIIAYNRKDSFNLHKNHIWIEIRDKHLFELMRPYFQGFNGFTGAVPGIDARHIFMQRKQLKALMPQPVKFPELSDVDKILYADLQQLLDFIKLEFADAALELEHMEQEDDPQIRWNLLWALFIPGDLLETQSDYGLEMAFRPKTWIYSDSNYVVGGGPYATAHGTVFEVQGEFLEWTGRKYTSTRMVRSIPKYPGTRPIDALEFKPLTPAKKSSFIERGLKYIKLTDVCHLDYKLFMMWKERDKNAGGETYPVYDTYGQRVINNTVKKEPAKGRVMIDILSYRRFNPEWDTWNSNDFSDQSSQEEDEPPTVDENSPDLCLLPPTVYGWSFALKRWGELSVNGLSPIVFEPEAFDHLVLPRAEKRLIQALVEAQANIEKMPSFGDVIPGKGRGLVMLFHGNTGTGKTLTAEAISEHLRLPLYVVSAPELAGAYGDMETGLKQILEISSVWKAIVLVNEADEFLRAPDDGWRSPTVGAFLRVLEYHSGILILTTNYVRNIDPAFMSRLNLAVNYRDLDLESRKILWGKLLSRLGATIEPPNHPESQYDFSQEDLATLAQRNTNGRVIQYAMRSAQALARLEQERLKLCHIEQVWMVQDAFEEEMQRLSSESTDNKQTV